MGDKAQALEPGEGSNPAHHLFAVRPRERHSTPWAKSREMIAPSGVERTNEEINTVDTQNRACLISTTCVPLSLKTQVHKGGS